MRIDGEGYLDKGFFIERYKYLKALGTPGLRRSSTYIQDEDTGKWQHVWVIEYEVEEVAPIVN